jgi:hypothetical protein
MCGGGMGDVVRHLAPMNKNKRTSRTPVGSPEGLSAGRLYTTSPDAVQRMHRLVQTRSRRAYADPVTNNHPWPSMNDHDS